MNKACKSGFNRGDNIGDQGQQTKDLWHLDIATIQRIGRTEFLLLLFTLLKAF